MNEATLHRYPERLAVFFAAPERLDDRDDTTHAGSRMAVANVASDYGGAARKYPVWRVGKPAHLVVGVDIGHVDRQGCEHRGQHLSGQAAGATLEAVTRCFAECTGIA